MASAVYSTRFCSNYAVSPAASYTVPPGYRAIVRDITAWYAAGSSPGYAYGEIDEVGGAFWYQTMGEGPSWAQFSGRVVLNEMETLAVVMNSTEPGTIIACGYLLTLP